MPTAKNCLFVTKEGIPIPESQGTVAAAVYILLLSVFIPFAFASYDLEFRRVWGFGV